MDLETAAKLNVYQSIVETAEAPTAQEVADSLGRSVAEVAEAFQSLSERRLLVLEAGTSEIRMAPPFSAVETPFSVEAGGQSYFANCVWDALGVAAALHRDVVVFTACGDCGEPMSLQVENGAPVPQTCTIHFAVPAAHWWDDIVHT